MPRHHTYILGAGFSVPLGGPLFSQLLSTEYSYLIDQLNGLPEQCESALKFLSQGQLSDDLQRQVPMNAEEVLEFVDWASRFPNHRKTGILMTSLGPAFSVGDQPENRSGRIRQLLRQIKRLVSCQCDAFVQDLENDSDRVKPYKDWLQGLSDLDYVVSFNYDTAIERIAEFSEADGNTTAKDFLEAQFYKPHGSAAWIADKQNGRGRHLKTQECAYLEDNDIAIAIPGRTKFMILEDNSFKNEWSAAEEAIANSEVVSIVGYRIPPTDNSVRSWLAESLRKNRPRINLVLGPSSGGIEAKRIVSMLEPLVGHGKVYDIPMYAQDYLARVNDYRSFDFPRS